MFAKNACSCFKHKVFLSVVLRQAKLYTVDFMSSLCNCCYYLYLRIFIEVSNCVCKWPVKLTSSDLSRQWREEQFCVLSKLTACHSCHWECFDWKADSLKHSKIEHKCSFSLWFSPSCVSHSDPAWWCMNAGSHISCLALWATEIWSWEVFLTYREKARSWFASCAVI